IIVENKAGDIIKHYKFVYNYFEDNSQEGYRSKFLKLTEILEVDLDGNERTAYSFTYYGNPPHRGSYAIDHLGFYNAQTSNKHLIPTYTRAQGIATVNGADRDPRGGASKVGMLESITYPTGGKTTFDYEAHDHYTGSSETKWVPRGHVAHAEYCNDEGIFTYDYDPEDTECQNPEGIRGLLCERVVEAVMEIPQGARNFEISIVPLFNEDGCDPVAIELGDLKVDIYELVGEQEILVWPYATNNLNQEEFDLDNKLFGGKTYVLRSESKVRGARIKGAVTYEVLNKNIQSVNTQTSGVRIKRITHENLAGYGPERQISYTYRQKRHGDRSSGRMLARNPSYGYEFEDRSGKNFVQTGNPVGALGTLNNSHIIYTEVKEEELGNGYTWSTFSFSGDELLPTIIEAPARLEMASSAWKGGHLIKEEIFDNDGNVLKWTENSYSYISKGTSSTFIYELKTDFTPPDWMNEFRWALGYQRSGWARLDETREYTHDKEAGLVLSSKTSYTYQPEESKLLLPIRIDYLLDDLSFYETIEYMDHRAPYHVIDPVRERTTFNNNNEVLEQLINSYGGQSDFDTYKLTRQRRLNSSGGVFAEQNLQYSDEIEQGSKPSYSSNHSGDKTQYLYSESTFDPVAKIVQTDPGLSFYNGFEEHPNATGARAKTGLKALNSGSYQITIEMFAPSSEAGLKMSYWFWDGDSWEFSGELDFNRNVNSAGSMIDELRVYQSGALMTTYTYKPLVGIITVTDPNNITTYYEYDHLNRLLGIRDEEGNIIENYHYQYWNE
ncbi:MAG: RHS repeat domain-containing protein, partial [Bacteroidota bacterium]